MIDIKKKIQAARDYASKGYRTIRRVSENCNMVVRDKNAAKHFLDGAEWAEEEFLKNLWHPASEMPDKNRTCLVRVVYHPNHGMLQDEERIEQSSFHDFGWYDYDFKYIGTNYDIISWLYVEDLLPKEGGEQ